MHSSLISKKKSLQDLSFNPKVLEVIPEKRCFLCSMGITESDSIKMFYCDLELCSYHLDLLRDECIARAQHE